jgi:hypothetical protein
VSQKNLRIYSVKNMMNCFFKIKPRTRSVPRTNVPIFIKKKLVGYSIFA